MALNIAKPFVNVTDSNGLPIVGARLYVYLPETTTLASIYSDEALTVPMTNPLTGVNASDAAGNFPRVYIAAGRYKLRAETIAGVLIWEYDKIDTGLSSGTGALPISGGGTGGTTATEARTNLDVPSNTELADLADDIANVQSSLQNIVSTPQGYLTATTGVPCISTGVTAGTSVFYTPDTGNLCPVYDGIQFNVVAFSELTLALTSNHVLNGIYDVFFTLDDGAALLVTGPAWTVPTAGSGARGSGAGTTELVRVSGLYTNKYAMTARNGATTYSIGASKGTYLGSIAIDATAGQITCHRDWGQTRIWSIWNAFNKRPIYLRAGDATGTWAGTGVLRASNGSSANSVTTFCGLADEPVSTSFRQRLQISATAGGGAIAGQIGIGWNSTTAITGTTGYAQHTSGGGGATQIPSFTVAGTYAPGPRLGKDVATACELGATACTFYGTQDHMLLEANWRG